MALNTVSATLMILLVYGAACAAEEIKINPHSETGDCTVCHVASADKLRSWFAFGSTKRAMKDDLNQLCKKCHTIEPIPGGALWVGIGHATGKKPRVNHKNLPLASDGTITCAITCHNMHGDPNDGHPSPKFLRDNITALCQSCHDR